MFHYSAGMSDAGLRLQNLMRNLQGGHGTQAAREGQLYTTLPDLLPASTTISVIDSASVSTIDNLLRHLPPVLLLLGQQAEADTIPADPNSETVQAAIEAMSLDQKKDIVRKVLHSPQFSQSLSSLTSAILDGGLPSIADALKIPLANGGFIQNGSVPLGGGDAVEAFVQGVKDSAKAHNEGEGRMETD